MYSIDKIVKININLSPSALAGADFGAFLILDGSGSKPTKEYTSIAEVAADFPEADNAVLKSATAYFSSLPRPAKVLISGYAINDWASASAALVSVTKFFYFVKLVNETGCSYADSSATDFFKTVEAMQKFVVTDESDTDALTPSFNGAARAMRLAGLRRGLSFWCGNGSVSEAAVARLGLVDFGGVNTTLTLEHKPAGVEGDNLLADQYANLEEDGYVINARVGSAGSSVASSFLNTMTHSQYGEYADDVHGLDVLTNLLQAEVYNALRTTATKLKYTPAGQQALISAATKVLEQFVVNGFLGEREFIDSAGEVRVTKGYEMISKAEDIFKVNTGDKQDRKAAPIQVDLYRAGAIHKVSVDLFVS